MEFTFARGVTPIQTIDPQEVENFSALAQEWWKEEGAFAILHKINPLRMQFIRDHLSQHFNLSSSHPLPLTGLKILDVGCGGGLLTEPLARLGAQVMGIDATARNIMAAQEHGKKQGLTIDYQHISVEELAATGRSFDVVISLEVLEHVQQPHYFLQTCASLIHPEGALILSTLNRSLQSYVLGIFLAERILRWVPKGTHQWGKFIRPRELQKDLINLGFSYQIFQGLTFSPFQQTWRFNDNLDVNYFVFASRHKKGTQHLEGGLSSWG